MRATVKWFNEQKGFGFVTGADGKDAFLHGSVVPDDLQLSEGLAVDCEIETGPRGPRVKTIKNRQTSRAG
jgi:CspA family cold shock protein